MSGDEYETYPISLSGFSGIGVSDDGKHLLASMNYSSYGIRLYAFRKNEEDRFCDEIEVILDTGDEEENKGHITSAAFGGNKAVFRKGRQLYMFNINELNYDDMEYKNCEDKSEETKE